MKEFAKDLIVAVVIAAILLLFVKPVIVKESSMESTLIENDYLVLSKQAYRFGEVKRGDIVVFKSELINEENGKTKLLIKRVIGLPGETVSIKEGRVYINGNELSEEYLNDGYTNGNLDELEIPDGELFCMGDNRLVSIDSRDPSVGPVDEDLIVGKVVLRLFPFNKIGTMDKPSYYEE